MSTGKLLKIERLVTVRCLTATGAARSIRTAAGASQAEVAAAAGNTRAAVAAWETGRRSPRGDAALRYLAVLERLSAFSEPDAAEPPEPS